MQSFRRRVVALVSSLVVVACVGGLAPVVPAAAEGPVAAPPTCAPSGTPSVVGGARDRLVVTVPQCATATGVTGYRLLRYEGTAASPVGEVDVPVGQVAAEVTGLTAGSVQRLAVVARNADGVGPASATSAPAPVPFTTVGAMADRQHRDLAGRAPSAAETTDWATRIGDGSVTPAELIDGLQAAPYWQKQSPVIRLYQAYFLRLPDVGGLDYWVGQSRGGRSLNDISQAFSASPEFRTLYGSLTNRQFVERIYQNILGRAGEPAGVDYWTGELDSRRKGRGAVMVGFSESPEYRTRTLAQVDVVNIVTGMLRRTPTAAEVTSWRTQPRTTVITTILGTAEYEARVQVIAPPFATTSALPNGTQGVAYTPTTLTATAGATPYTWAIATGALPAGLTLSPAGVVSGTPTAAGTATAGIRVTDSAGRATTRTYTIVIGAPSPVISTTSLPTGTRGVAYSHDLAVSGGTSPYEWDLSAGTLPAGLTLSPEGTIAGTPAATGTATITVRVTDAADRIATKALTLAVVAPPTITTTSLAAGTQGVGYSQTLAATGGTTPYTWSLASSTPPAGITLSTGGSLSGTPTGTGTSSFTVRVTDAGGRTATKALSIAVVAPPTITTSTLPGATQGTAYSRTLAATGGTTPYTWSIATGTLPAGLELSAAGAITGTPTGSGTSTSTFTVRVTDSAGRTATRSLSIAVTVPPGPVVTTTSLPGAQAGVGYAHQITATSGTAPYTWAVTAGGLPGGITLDPATGLLSGTAATTTSASFTVRVTDAASRSSTKDLTLAVTAATGWPQTDADEGHRAWTPNETTLTPANAAGTGRVWGSALTSGDPVVDGGTAYAIRSDGLGPRLDAMSLATGTTLWTLEAPAGQSWSDVALTPTAFVIAGGQRTVAYSRSSRALIWDTATTDPGTYANRVVLVGTTAVVEGNGAVTAYRLSDGERLWQVLTPTGAGTIRDMAASGTRVVVVHENVVRALNLANGSQAWSRAATTSAVVIADGAVYVADAGTLRRYALADGAPGWTATGSDGYAANTVLGADATYVYMSTYLDGGRNVEARRLADGTLAWARPMDGYYADIAIAGDIVWINATYFATDNSSQVAAVDRTTGATVYERSLDQLSNGVVVAGGHALVTVANGYRNGLAGGLWAFGLAPPLPVVPPQTLGAGQVAATYSQALRATEGTGPYTWSRTAGALPAGLTLSPDGTIGGTPTAAGTATFTVTVTDARGRTASRQMRLQVHGAAITAWRTRGGGAARNPAFAPDAAITPDTVATIAGRWRTAVPTSTGGATYGAASSGVIVVGNRMYAIDADGALKAWSTTGTGTDRAPIWTATPTGSGVTFQGLAESGGTLFVSDTAAWPAHVYAIRASDGVQLWKTDVDIGYRMERPPLVVGDIVAFIDPAGLVRAYSTSTGAPAWGGAPVSIGAEADEAILASDGTRIFGQVGCRVRAITAATGAVAWTSYVDRGSEEPNCNAYNVTNGHPVVADGTVYVGSGRTVAAFNATTGAVRWRAPVPSPAGDVIVAATAITVANGIVLVNRGIQAGPMALDQTTGEVTWIAQSTALNGQVTVVGDLAVANSFGYLSIFDVRTGEELARILVATEDYVYTTVAPTIVGGRIYVLTTQQGIRTFAPPA